MPASSPTPAGSGRSADRALRRLRDVVDPPHPRARVLHLAGAALLFAAVFAVKVTGLLGPADAPSVLYVAPIALAAVSLGPFGGLGAAVLAIVLMSGSELLAEQHLRPAGMATRGAVFLVTGGSLGLLLQQLRAGAEAMRALSGGLAELGDALVVLDEQAWTILHVSPTAATVFRRTPERLVGMTLDQLAEPEERARLEHRRRMRAAGHRIPARGEFDVRGGAGERLRIEVAVMPALRRRRREWIAVVRDISAQREAERRLAADHRFLRTVLDTAATPIAVLDAAGRIAMVNGAMERLAGMGAAMLTGRTPWDLELVDRAAVPALAAALRDGGDPVHHVAPWRCPAGGERTIAWTATAVRDRAGAVAHAVFIGLDITDQRAAEDRARRAHAALQLSSRELERSHRDLGQIVAAASRDLREPLGSAIASIAEAEARAGTALDAGAREQLALASEALLRLEARLDALGDYGRLAPGEAVARDVDVDATVDLVLADMARDIAARGASVTRDPVLPTVAGDPDELRELLGHLVANALEHGGATPRIHVGAARRGLAWELCIADDGPGVPAAERRRIFRVFGLPGDAGADGVGVGLAVCRRIAERHGGAIWVDEAPTGGSAFHVRLPDREAR